MQNELWRALEVLAPHFDRLKKDKKFSKVLLQILIIFIFFVFTTKTKPYQNGCLLP
jgi:hypothetical protein